MSDPDRPAGPRDYALLSLGVDRGLPVLPGDRARRETPLRAVDVSPTVASGAHLVHFYDDDDALVDRLEDYVLEGWADDEAALIVATADHRLALRDRLRPHGLHVQESRGRFVDLDAAHTLRGFMRQGMPHPMLFRSTVGTAVDRLTSDGGRVRAYGEMVALLWDTGADVAALALEDLWNDLQRNVDFPLLCAYPASVASAGYAEICSHHSHVVAA